MNYLGVLFFVVFSFSTANAQLLCYTCDDCESDGVASVEPCGYSQTVATTVWPGQSGPGYPCATNQNYCFLTQWNSPCYQYLPCDPFNPVMPCYPHYPMPQCVSFNPTYPCFVFYGKVEGGGGGGGWDLATPPVTQLPWWPAAKEANLNAASPTEASTTGQQFGCLTSKSKVDDRDVVRRGCARLESSNNETCNKATGGKHQKCAVCTSQLCNSETF